MRSLPRTAWVYIIFVWAVAAALLGISLYTAPPPFEQLILLPLWTLIFVLADYFEVAFEFEEGKQLLTTVYEAVIIFLVAVSGMYALPAIVIGSLVTDTLHRRPWFRCLFNAAERVITYTAMWQVYQLVAPVGGLPFAGPQGLLSLVATVMTYYVLNTLLVGTVIALYTGEPILRVIRLAYMKVQWVHFITLPLGAVLAAVWSMDRWLLLAGVVPLLLAQRAFIALAAWQVENRKNTELARQVEQLQGITTAMVTSLNPSVVLDTISVRLSQHLGARASWVVLPDTPRARVAAAHGPLPAWAETSAANLTASRSHAILELSGAQLPPADPADQPPVHALAAIPMALEDRVLGYICLVFDEPVTLGETQRRVLQAFATQAALIMEHATLFDALQRKQNELVRSSKLAALGTFSAGIAHEFNNILAGILGFAQLGKSSNDLDEQRESLAIIEQSCVRARGITSGLLAFARRGPSQRRLSLVRDAVEAALVLIERELAKIDILIERHYGPTPPTVCDSDQLTQVVLNLLTNARDAMRDQGGGTITIYLERRDRMIELRVRDTGCGIPEDLLDQIFQPFMTTKGALGGSTTPGTGLGLAISYGIIESHGGTIDVISQVGAGTTFTIRLPIIDETQETEIQHSAAPSANGLRILLVDDDPQVLSAIAQLLGQHGHRVKVAPGGAAALQAYRNENFDLVLSDAVMPGMDGAALLQRLQELNPRVRVLTMTGQAGSPQAEQMLQAGAIGPLIKPFTIEELLGAIAPFGPSIDLAPRTRPSAHRLV